MENPNENPKSIREEIRLLKEAIENTPEPKKKKGEFKIPWSARVGTKSAKKNNVTVMTINENGTVNFIRTQIKDQVIHIEGLPRISTADMVLRYKKNPLVILPLWSMKPFSAQDNFNDVEKQKMNTKGYRLLMDIMKREAISTKKPFGMSWGLIIILLLVAAGAAYYFLGGNKLFGGH